MNRKITTLYEHFKNTPKKLKIICDWDEVIQACEPYALWKTLGGEFEKKGIKIALANLIIVCNINIYTPLP